MPQESERHALHPGPGTRSHIIIIGLLGTVAFAPRNITAETPRVSPEPLTYTISFGVYTLLIARAHLATTNCSALRCFARMHAEWPAAMYNVYLTTPHARSIIIFL